MSFATISLTTPASGLLLAALNRPNVANALNTQMAQELAACLDGLDASVRAVVLTGAGRHFCAGADLKERRGMDEAQWEVQHQALRAARDAVLACPAPVIAAVNGAAMGGGLELALACDFIYAAEGAKFALTEATLGIMPGMGGTQALPRAVGQRRALELLYTGRVFPAREAEEWGMVNKICENPLDEALETAGAIAANAPLSVRAIKRAVRQGLSLPIPEALEAEREIYAGLVKTQDRIEGINAFNEKRKPDFRGA